MFASLGQENLTEPGEHIVYAPLMVHGLQLSGYVRQYYCHFCYTRRLNDCATVTALRCFTVSVRRVTHGLRFTVQFAV